MEISEMSLSEEFRKLIIQYHTEGKSLCEIGRIVKRSFSTVRNIVNKYEKTVESQIFRNPVDQKSWMHAKKLQKFIEK